jgi:glycosyltransferase involved in cell wall biosynthesis
MYNNGKMYYCSKDKVCLHPLPLVSVIIPTYNCAQWLTDTIKSVLYQTYPNIEIIVVDDGSTDNTCDVVSKFKNVKYIKNSSNVGECITSHIGFEAASGEYLSRLSADDFYLNSNKIEHQVMTMERTKSDWSYFSINCSGSILHGANIIYSVLLPVPFKYTRPVLQIFNNIMLKFPHFVLLRLLLANPINSNTLMFKKSSYMKSVKWSKDIFTDCDGLLLYMLFLQKFKCVSICEMGSFYRIHPNQMTNNINYIGARNKNKLFILNKIINENYPFWLKCSAKIFKKLKLYDMHT